MFEKKSEFLDLVDFCRVCVILTRPMYDYSTTSGWRINKLWMNMMCRARYVSSFQRPEHSRACQYLFHGILAKPF